MKQLIMVFTFIGLILASCSDEFEKIDEEVEIPETTELITANIQGLINDTNGELLDNITVDILVDGILLASTESTNGRYSFENQAAHPSRTILRAHSKNYAPNFTSISIPIENELVMQDFIVDLLTNRQAYKSSEALIYQPSDAFTVSFSESSFPSGNSNVELVSTVFTFPENNEKLISTRVGISAAGETRQLSLRSVYYVGAYTSGGAEALLKSEKEFTVSIPASASETLWAFDTTLGNWKEIETISTEPDKYLFNSKDLTYYASVSGDCTNDVDPPTPLCLSNITLLYGTGENKIWAEDIDFNSMDNCSTDLVFDIKKLNDTCANGSDVYGPSILFCAAECGQTIPVRMQVTDEAGNSDYCDVNIIIAGTPDCTNDITPPVAVCTNLSTVLVDNNTIQVYAVDFDNGSYDNCSTSLDFQVKKIVDLCANGSDEYNESVTFCSAEIGTTSTVNLLVTDENGNGNSCQISVNIIGDSDCTNDVTPPVAVCTNLSTVLVDCNPILVNAVDFNIGSYDNCSTTLDFQVKKLVDLCANGSDEYSETVTFCPVEIGTTTTLGLLVTDENGNSNSCQVFVNITGDSDCTNDTKAPTPYCVQGLTVKVENTAVEVFAIDFDIGSFDNCSQNVDFKIRKMTDICSNGSDLYGEKISFCPAEIGNTITLRMLVSDENNNSDYCVASVTVQ